jgi:hypothetical protein
MRFGGVWEEIAGVAGRREIRGGRTLCGRVWRFLGDALIKLDVGLGLAEEVPGGIGPRPSSQSGDPRAGRSTGAAALINAKLVRNVRYGSNCRRRSQQSRCLDWVVSCRVPGVGGAAA